MVRKETWLWELHHTLKDWIILCLLLDVQLNISKHGLQGVFETVGLHLLTRVLLLVVSDSKECLQELGIVQAVVNIQCVLNGNLYKVDFLHAFNCVSGFFPRLGEAHCLNPIEERLPDNIQVLFLWELLFMQPRVEFKVVHKFLMINRKNRHRSIEIFFTLMESKIHSLEVDLKLLSVLLLLGNLLLLFVS